MRIENAKDLRNAFRNGPYAWPGGYPMFFLMGDNEAISFEAAKKEQKQLLEALRDKRKHGPGVYSREWLPVALEVNWEDASLYCAHTNKRIESAYAEEEA